MQFDDRKHQYLFERHSVDEVRSWNRRLRFFRYFRAFGGHTNDSDSLDVALRYSGQQDLLTALGKLGIHPRRFTKTPPQPKTGVSYPSEEFEKFPSIVEGTRWVEQPGHTEIFGAPVFIWCHKERIMISLTNDSWDIDESTVRAAESIEPYITTMSGSIIDPPWSTDHYLCGANHPILK